MKLFKAFLYVLLVVGFISCDKQLEEPTFGMSVHSERAQTDKPILFSLTGNVEILTFYSGEPGSEYVKRNGIDPVSGEIITPDKPVKILKSYSQPFPSEFSYLYTKPGVYVATFVGKNVYQDSENTLVQELVIIVE